MTWGFKPSSCGEWKRPLAHASSYARQAYFIRKVVSVGHISASWHGGEIAGGRERETEREGVRVRKGVTDMASARRVVVVRRHTNPPPSPLGVLQGWSFEQLRRGRMRHYKPGRASYPREKLAWYKNEASRGTWGTCRERMTAAPSYS